MQSFYLRMVFSHNFRKLYTLLLLMAILVFSFVAYQVQPNEIGAHVTALLALLLFKFSYADNLLHRLHDNRNHMPSLLLPHWCSCSLPICTHWE